MEGLRTFIDQARAQGWDENRIREALTANGWSVNQVEAGLSNLVVPKPPVTAPEPAAKPVHGGRPSITALQAALQHILLWLFTFTSSIMINVVSFALFAAGEGSSKTLLVYVVLEVVTFVPFALFYGQYLRTLRRKPDVMTGRVWSIMTVVLHTIGLLSSVVGFVLVLLLVHDAYYKAGLISSGVVGLMNGLVVLAYVLANFAKAPKSLLRRRYLQVFPVLLFILIASLGVIALFKVGPLRADDQTRQNLSDAVSQIHGYASDHHKLPNSLADLHDVPTTISYKRTSTITYKVCATYKKPHGGFEGTTREAIDDSYVSTSDFSSDSAGFNCWQFKDYDLANSLKIDPYGTDNGSNYDSRFRTD